LNLNEVILTLEKMLHRIIGEDITVTLRLAPALGQVKADRSQMEQMILNLVVNSRDAMPQGGCLTIETANITLEGSATSSSGPYIRIAITDTGIGMSQETLVHIFEPFFTTKEVGKGTGLGLAMVHSIVEQSGGYITVESKPGQGTVFKLYLSRHDEPPEQPQSLLLTVQQGRGSETVLLVEDEPELRDLIKKVLTQQGYTVLAVGDGKEALHLCSQHGLAIDILLTDVVLPGGVNGQGLAEQLWQKCPHLKVLFISGYTDDEIIRQRVLKEEVAFLQKPFGITRLIEKVREVLEAPPS
jgi:CheY-like chemotaxis protein